MILPPLLPHLLDLRTTAVRATIFGYNVILYDVLRLPRGQHHLSITMAFAADVALADNAAPYVSCDRPRVTDASDSSRSCRTAVASPRTPHLPR